eukprot:GHVN01045508.1.p1 GENE.GHVN01045508.1~~GHVN01045508.1.p1  ORF type:complete len:120 (-),score=24.59 GHVN01045508.1:189-548(-)
MRLHLVLHVLCWAHFLTSTNVQLSHFTHLAHSSPSIHPFADASPPSPRSPWTTSRTHPHDTHCFTEGLFHINSTHLVESCGLTGKSYIRVFDLVTGETSQTIDLPKDYFAEGIAVYKDR